MILIDVLCITGLWPQNMLLRQSSCRRGRRITSEISTGLQFSIISQVLAMKRPLTL